MQKKLIAAAVAGLAASGAYAQSNVEIYGLVEMNAVSLTGSYSGKIEGTTSAFNTYPANINGVQTTYAIAANQNGYFNGVGKSGHSWNGMGAGATGVQGAGAINLTEYGSRAELASGMKEQSRIGFRGTEDLGGGLKASFVIESSIAGDGSVARGSNNNPTANILGDRETTVALTSSNWGRIKLGRQSVVSTDLIGYFDPFLGKGPGGVEQLIINPVTTTTANNAIRFDTKLMDVNLTYEYAMAENSDRLNNTTGPGSVSNLTAYYAAGPLKLQAGHAVVRDYANGIATTYGAAVGAALGAPVGNLAAATLQGRSLWLNHLGARYDFGPVELYAQYLTTQSSKTATDESGGLGLVGVVDQSAVAVSYLYGSENVHIYQNLINNNGLLLWLGQGGPMVNSSTYLLGFTAPMGAHKFLGSFVGTNDKRSWNQDARSVALGYEYSLSKRTTLQLRGAKVYNTNGSEFGVVGGGGQNVALGFDAASATAGYGRANQRTTAYLAGIKHTF